MTRLHLIVEGKTEQAFATKVLIPQLAAKGVGLYKPQLAAHARRKGAEHRGGVLSYLPFRSHIVRRLKGDQPYIQLHEFEATLLAQPDAILTYYGEYGREVARLTELALSVKSPELIDDGEDTAPSKRIISLIPAYGKAKPTAGPTIAAAIGLPTIRAKCPHFDAWLRQLEKLGQKPDQGSM